MKIDLIKLFFLLTLTGLVTCQQNCKTYCYTRWFNRDHPSGYGDYEIITHLPKKQVCCNPVGAQCQTVDGRPYNSTGDFLAHACTLHSGVVCVNSWQKAGKRCQDYRVRFLCPQGSIRDTSGIQCETYCDMPFKDNDNPSGYCDCEGVNNRGPSCPGGVTPAGIRCQEVSTGRDYKQIAGQNITCQPDVGLFCWNKNNPGGCKDYKVQYICPKTVKPTCASGLESVAEEQAAEEDFIDEMDFDETEEDFEADMEGEELHNKNDKSAEDLLMEELLQSLLNKKN